MLRPPTDKFWFRTCLLSLTYRWLKSIIIASMHQAQGVILNSRQRAKAWQLLIATLFYVIKDCNAALENSINF